MVAKALLDHILFHTSGLRRCLSPPSFWAAILIDVRLLPSIESYVVFGNWPWCYASLIIKIYPLSLVILCLSVISFNMLSTKFSSDIMDTKLFSLLYGEYIMGFLVESVYLKVFQLHIYGCQKWSWLQTPPCTCFIPLYYQWLLEIILWYVHCGILLIWWRAYVVLYWRCILKSLINVGITDSISLVFS